MRWGTDGACDCTAKACFTVVGQASHKPPRPCTICEDPPSFSVVLLSKNTEIALWVFFLHCIHTVTSAFDDLTNTFCFAYHNSSL